MTIVIKFIFSLAVPAFLSLNAIFAEENDDSIQLKNNAPITCKPNWIPFNKACFRPMYIKNKYFRKTWDSSEKICKDLKSELVSFSNIEETRNITFMHLSQYTHRDFWIGLKKKAGEDKFKWLKGNKELKEENSFWANGHPIVNKPRELCVYSSTEGGKWKSAECDLPLNLLCKGDENATDSAPKFEDIPCDNDKFKDWKRYKDTNFCYKFPTKNSDKKTWNTALADCEKLSEKTSRLVSILSEDESDFLKFHLENIELDDSQIWTGYRHLITGNWLWADNQTSSYENFLNGAKNPSKGFCTLARTGEEMKWETRHCQTKLHYICKKQKTEGDKIPYPDPYPKDGNCEHNYLEFQDLCYNFIEDSMNYTESTNNNCLLPSVTSEEVQAFLTSHLGYRSHAHERFWLGLRETDEKENFLWMDNNELHYENFAEQQSPSNEMRCVSMSSELNSAGKWIKESCSKKNARICVKPKGNNPPLDNPCAKGFTRYSKACYKVVDKKMKWEDAEKECKKSNKSSLASIANVYEQNFFFTLIENKGEEYWIGLTNKEDIKHFRWSDKQPVHYLNWEKEPDFKHPKCAMIKDAKKWNPKDCTDSRNFICKYFLNEQPPTVKPPTGNCQQIGGGGSWHEHDSNCFMAMNAVESFSNAQHECQKRKSTLLFIKSEKEQAYVLNLMKNTITESEMWIGMRNTTGEWLWLDGTKVEFHNFENNKTDGKYAVFKKPQGFWEAREKEPSPLPFICQFSTIAPTTRINDNPTTGTTDNPTTGSNSKPTTGKTDKPVTITTPKPSKPITGTTANTPVSTKKPPKQGSSGLSPGGKATIALTVLMIIALLIVVLLYFRYKDAPEIRDMKNIGGGPRHGPTFNNPITLEGNELRYDSVREP